MPRKAKTTLALNQKEAAKVESISPVHGAIIEVKDGENYFKKAVNEVTEEQLIRSYKYYKWSREKLLQKLDYIAKQEGLCLEEMDFRAITIPA